MPLQPDLLARLRRPASLAGRLMVWYSVSTLAISLVAVTILYWGLARELRQGTDALLSERIQVLRALLQEGPSADHELRWEVESEWEWLEHHEIFLRILDRKGDVMLQTNRMAPLVPAEVFPAPVAPGVTAQGYRVLTPAGARFQVMAAQAVGSGPEDHWVIQAAFHLHSQGEVLHEFKLLLAWVAGLASLASLGLGYHITRSGLRPLREIVDTTQRIRSSTLSERIQVRKLPPELASLTDSFNDMLERLQESFARLSRFSADIAHELRTPLSNLRGEAEVALSRPRTAEEYRDILVSSVEEYTNLSRTIDRLLFIAQAERSAVPIHRERVNMCAELRAVLEFYEPALAEKRLDVQVSCADAGLWCDADRELFRRAVGNLVSNALSFTPPGGAVELRAEQQDGSVRVQVHDTGIGIAPEHLPHVFDRFYRVERTRMRTARGSGLGLSIVKAVMDLHGGSVEIKSRRDAGTTVTLVFPKPPTEAATSPDARPGSTGGTAPA